MSVFAPPRIRVRIKGYKDSKSRGQKQMKFAFAICGITCRLFKVLKVLNDLKDFNASPQKNSPPATIAAEGERNRWRADYFAAASSLWS